MYLKSNLTLTVSQSSSHSRFCGCLMYLDFMLPDHQPLSLPAGLNLSLQYLPLLLARLIPVIAPHCILLWFTRHGSLMYGRTPKEAGRSPRCQRLPVSSCFLYHPPTSIFLLHLPPARHLCQPEPSVVHLPGTAPGCRTCPVSAHPQHQDRQ